MNSNNPTYVYTLTVIDADGYVIIENDINFDTILDYLAEHLAHTVTVSLEEKLKNEQSS